MRSRRTLTAIAAALAFALAGAPARAQDAEIGRPYRVHDHGEARRYANDFARHSTERDWARAVRALQSLLDLPPDRGYVLMVPGSLPIRYEGVGRRARRLFDSLPEEGRAVWRETYGQDAERLLQRGVRMRRTEDLRQAARRFPAKDVRRRAHEALASLALASGSFGEAAFELLALLEVTDGPDERAQVFARLAFARAQSGDREGTDRVLTLSRDVRGVAVPGPEGPEQLGVFLDRMTNAAGPAVAGSSGWPQFGGDRHGRALAESAPPPGNKARWRVPTNYEEGDETDSDRPFRWVIREDTSHRPVFPVVAQGVVYLNNGLSLRAVDLSSGNALWQKNGDQRAARWRDNKLAAHSAAVADGVVYAALATRADAPDMEREFYGRTIVYSLPHRSLYALDARTGDVLWSHQDERLEGRPDAREGAARLLRPAHGRNALAAEHRAGPAGTQPVRPPGEGADYVGARRAGWAHLPLDRARRGRRRASGGRRGGLDLVVHAGAHSAVELLVPDARAAGHLVAVPHRRDAHGRPDRPDRCAEPPGLRPRRRAHPLAALARPAAARLRLLPRRPRRSCLRARHAPQRAGPRHRESRLAKQDRRPLLRR
jgi:hypothetical protein